MMASSEFAHSGHSGAPRGNGQHGLYQSFLFFSFAVLQRTAPFLRCRISQKRMFPGLSPFYLLTRGFNWELELNMKVAQSPYERKGYSLGLWWVG